MSESYSFTALDYESQTALDISGQTHVTIKYDLSDSINNSFRGVIIQSGSDVYFRWDNSENDTIDTPNDLIVYANSTFEINVPIKLASKSGSIYLHFKQIKSVGGKKIRWVKIR